MNITEHVDIHTYTLKSEHAERDMQKYGCNEKRLMEIRKNVKKYD
jgi:hypothetical protein